MFATRTYTFDITKCGERFDLLVKIGHIIIPHSLKSIPLEQRKNIGFCKYHNLLGHKTSQCLIFRDLVQKALNDGRLQFGEKPKSSMKVDSDPIQMDEAYYAEPIGTLMVEVIDSSNIDGDKGEQISTIDDSDFQEVYPQSE